MSGGGEEGRQGRGHAEGQSQGQPGECEVGGCHQGQGREVGLQGQCTSTKKVISTCIYI